MNSIAWNTFLFASKWVLIGLVYVALTVILVTVRREMSIRLKGHRRIASAAPGRIRVLDAGGDPNIRPGSLFQLLPETSLGAEAENDIVLKDPYISGFHARLHWDGATWWIEDLGSRNGTYLNQRLCPPRSPQRLLTGVNIQLGDMVFELLD